MAKRNIFDELMEGVAAMKGRREGKITLRTFKVEPRPHDSKSTTSTASA